MLDHRWTRSLLAAFAGAAVFSVCQESAAAGLYFSDRGVRPMGRAGAFVAGADDLGAIWYNPAGVADSGTSILADFTWLRLESEYTRELLITDASGTNQRVISDKVEGNTPVLPLPTIVGSYQLDDWVFAGGVYAPYVALAGYPGTVNGQPSPARYTLGSFTASRVALPGFWVGYSPTDWLKLGAGVQALVGTVRSSITFSVSLEDRLIGAPEQPEFDAESQFEIGPIFSPSLNGGFIVIPHEMVRIGVSGHTPSEIDSDAKIKVRLPNSVIFDRAQVSGEAAHVNLTLAGILRAGVEVRPNDQLRVEATFVREFWSQHDRILAKPQGIGLLDLPGGPARINLPSIEIPRNFRDANSYRVGGEYSFELAGYEMDARLGLAYEESAVPDKYLSLSSLDFDKVLVSIGGSLHIGEHWRLDALYAHAFSSEVYVDPATAKVGRINPVKGNAPFEPVNGGLYDANAQLIGFGLEYRFGGPGVDDADKPTTAPSEPRPKPAAKPEPKPKPAKKAPEAPSEPVEDLEEPDEEIVLEEEDEG